MCGAAVQRPLCSGKKICKGRRVLNRVTTRAYDCSNVQVPFKAPRHSLTVPSITLTKLYFKMPIQANL